MAKLSDILTEDPEQYLEEGILSEAGLNRVIKHTDKPFAILTAFRGGRSLKDNRKENKKLEGYMKAFRMGGIKLSGVWQEAPDGMDWKEAKKLGKTEEIVESSYFIPIPKDMEYQQFENLITNLTKKLNQDAAIIGDGDQVYFIYKNGTKEKFATKLTVNKMGQAYSKIQGKSVPFIFEGIILPSSNIHRQAMQNRGLTWPSMLEENETD